MVTRTFDTDWLPHGDPDTPFEDSVHALAGLKDEGLVRHVGLSNVSVNQTGPGTST
jgi:aryl-alcohol dehydrogenase-like predicted oxidoreductase